MRLPLPSHKQPNYVGIYLVLAGLTVIELGIAFLAFSKSLQIPLLLSLAFAKASLLVLYYMHLKFDSRLYTAFFLMALAFGAVRILSLLMGNLW
jgi:caa(3)-type oxidase subunit IV